MITELLNDFKDNRSILKKRCSLFFSLILLLFVLQSLACTERAKHRISSVLFESQNTEVKTEYTYDDKDHLIKIISGDLRTEFTYSEEQQIRKKEIFSSDEIINVVRYEWKEGSLVNITEEEGSEVVSDFEYNDKGLLTNVEQRYSLLGTSFRIDTVFTYEKDSERLLSLQRDSNYRLLTVDVKEKHLSVFEHSDENLLTKIIVSNTDQFDNKSESKILYFYNEDKKLEEVKTEQHLWVFEYDDMKRIHRIKDKENKIEYTYSYEEGEVKDLYLEIGVLDLSFLFDLNGKFHESTDLKSLFWYYN